jgi:hypothetical protein
MPKPIPTLPKRQPQPQIARAPAGSLSVAQYIPEGSPVPTEVHLVLGVGADAVIIAFKSPERLMDTLLQLMEAGAQVWPTLGKMWREIE